MDTTPQSQFAARLAEACDDMQVPLRGRQARLHEYFGVSYQAVKKWLDGAGYPELAKAVKIADWAGVNVNWLLQGTLPKRGVWVDPDWLLLVEAIDDMPHQHRQSALDMFELQISKLPNWFLAEHAARYKAALQHLRDRSTPAAPGHAAAASASGEQSVSAGKQFGA